MAKRGGFPGGMPGNMNNLMKQAQKMQRQMEEAQKELEEKEVTAAAGGGAVEVTVSGKHEITKVKLSPEVVDPDDIEMLEDLIMAAANRGLPSVRRVFPEFHGKDYRRHGRTWRNAILIEFITAPVWRSRCTGAVLFYGTAALAVNTVC